MESKERSSQEDLPKRVRMLEENERLLRRTLDDFEKKLAMLNRTEQVAEIGSWEWDVVTDRVTWSEGLFRLFQFEGADKPGRWAEHGGHTHPEDMARLRQASLKASLDGTPYEMEIRTFRKDGEPRWCLARGFPEKDVGGRIVRLYGTVQDITELKQNETERRQLEKQFCEAQKMESIGRLTGGAAHDLNNLLTPILGYAELLLNHMDFDDRRREAVNDILQAGRRARNLVSQLLAVGRQQTLAPQTMDLNGLLNDFKSLLRSTFRENITIRTALAENLPYIKGDPGQIEQIIMNLAVNAQDAMDGGGELTIMTALAALPDKACQPRPSLSPGLYATLIFKDTGCGMDESIRRHIFEPFFTTKKNKQRNGLGLASVYGIVKQHQGDIQVDSQIGQGSTFTIYLPVAGEETVIAEAVTGATPRTFSSVIGSETILLSEDDDQLRKMARRLLEDWGYTVLAAADGPQALTLMNDYEGEVHLLLTDVILPEMNGRELYRRARSGRPEIKVLYMSGYVDDVLASHGILDEGVRLLRKPFQAFELAAWVRDTLDN